MATDAEGKEIEVKPDLTNKGAESDQGNPDMAKKMAEEQAAEAAKFAEEKAAKEKAAEVAAADALAAKETDDQSDEDRAKAEGLDVETWGTTGDDVGDSVLEMLQNSEMAPEDAKALLYDAVKAGDPEKIDKEALIEKVGKAKANLVMAGIENFVSKNNDKIAATMSVVHEEAGGKENWALVAPWAKANIDAAELSDLGEMIDAGGAKAKFATSQMVAKYNAADGNNSLGKPATTLEGDVVVTTVAVEGITARQYADQLAMAHRANDQNAINKIQRARQAGRKQGI